MSESVDIYIYILSYYIILYYIILYIFLDEKNYLRLDAIINLLQMGSYNFQSFSSFLVRAKRLYGVDDNFFIYDELFARWVVVVSSLWQKCGRCHLDCLLYAPQSTMNSGIDVGVV
jgi:hypothetical protein